MQDLYNTDDDFRDFVTNPERLNKIMRKGMNWEAYKKANKVLEKVSTEGEASPEEIAEIYKCFNYILPNDGKGNEAIATDVANQRKKFFDELKSKGYGAVLDTNDAYYGGYGNNVETPIIMFDMEQVIPNNIKELSYLDIMRAFTKTSKEVASRARKGEVI